MKKILPLLISVALVLSISLCALPANAIEIDAPTIGTVTSMEDMMTMAENYVSPTGLYQGDKQYCYLVLLRANTAGITNLNGSLSYSSYISTAECSMSEKMIELSRPYMFFFGKEESKSYKKTFPFGSAHRTFTAPATGSDILEFRLQSEYYFSPESITVTYEAKYGGSLNTNSGLTVKKLLAGDADGDGRVSSSDAQLIMQAAVDISLISEDNAIAADVDRDGRVGASDALCVLQYTVDDMVSFWNHGINSTEENEKIVSGKIYRMRCEDTGKNLNAPVSGQIKLSDYVRTEDKYKFRFTYLGNGLYKITSKADGTMALTAGDEDTVDFATYSSSNDAQKWYVNSVNDLFYLTPKSSRTTFLTSSGATTVSHGYNAVGGLWKIYGAEVTIYNYYDNSYVKRHASSGVTPQDYISDCQAKLNAVLESVFDLKVINGNTPTLMRSYVDQCTELDPNDLDSYCNRCPDSECAGATDNDKKDFTKGHHTSFLKNIYYFQEQYPENTKAKEIRAFSIGHNLCVYDDNGSHISCWAGVSLVNTKSPCVALVDVHEDDRTYRSLCTMLHEQSHQLGALKETTGGKADNNHGECVMSYNRTNSLIASFFDDPTKYNNLYCSVCKQAIKTYIDNSL